VRRGEAELVMADIPGLIPGAHEGRGLGSEFLRHISRCRLIVLVIDGAGSEGRDPLGDLRTLERELALFSPELAQRPRVLVSNKRDLEGWEAHWAALQAAGPFLGAFGVSAAGRQGTDELAEFLLAQVAALPPRHAAPEARPPVITPAFQRNPAVVRVDDGAFVIRGESVERLVQQADLDNAEAVDYLLERLTRLGVPARLRRAGARPGDAASIGAWHFRVGEDGAPTPEADPAAPELGGS